MDIIRPDSTRRFRRSRLWLIPAIAVTLFGLLPTNSASADFVPNPGTPARGPSGEVTPKGGRVTTVDVEISGDGFTGRPGRRTASIPAMCWWQAALGPSTDPQAMLTAYDTHTLQQATRNTFAAKSWTLFLSKRSYIAAERADFVKAVADNKPPGSVAWYMAVCRDGATNADYAAFLGGSTVLGHVSGIRFAAFPTGHPPAAHIAPVDLALYARSILNLPAPIMDRNPKITKAGQATLVGLPTWFWVTNPAATAAPTGHRTIHAQAGTTWATLTASNTGLTITSDAGHTICTPQQAATTYTPGTPQSSACTLTFTRASVNQPNGWPTTATTTWHLTWTGSGNTGDDLGTQPHTWTTTIPVAEVQTIVTN